MRDVVIVEACRTAVGNLGGTLKDVSAVELATTVLGYSRQKRHRARES